VPPVTALSNVFRPTEQGACTDRAAGYQRSRQRDPKSGGPVYKVSSAEANLAACLCVVALLEGTLFRNRVRNSGDGCDLKGIKRVPVPARYQESLKIRKNQRRREQAPQ
jgi:hypothetical protein